MCLGVFSRWQRAIAIVMHFHVFQRLYSSSAITADGRDNIVVSQRVLGKYQTHADTPRYYCKSNIAQHVVIV